MSKSSREPEYSLDSHTFAIRFGEDVEIGSSDTTEFVAILEELRKLGVEVEFDGVIYGLPWCG